MESLLIVAAVFVFLPLIFTAVVFVSIVWTHRPDLSVFDILRESMKEIQEIRNTRAGKKNRQKGIRTESDGSRASNGLKPGYSAAQPLYRPFRYCKTKYYLTETGHVVTRANKTALPRDRRKIREFHRKVQQVVLVRLVLEDAEITGGPGIEEVVLFELHFFSPFLIFK